MKVGLYFYNPANDGCYEWETDNYNIRNGNNNIMIGFREQYSFSPNSYKTTKGLDTCFLMLWVDKKHPKHVLASSSNGNIYNCATGKVVPFTAEGVIVSSSTRFGFLAANSPMFMTIYYESFIARDSSLSIAYINPNLPHMTPAMAKEIMAQNKSFGIFGYGNRLLELRKQCSTQGVEGKTFLMYAHDSPLDSKPLAVAKIIPESCKAEVENTHALNELRITNANVHLCYLLDSCANICKEGRKEEQVGYIMVTKYAGETLRDFIFNGKANDDSLREIAFQITYAVHSLAVNALCSHGDLHNKNVCVRKRPGTLTYKVEEGLYFSFAVIMFATIIDFGHASRVQAPNGYAMSDLRNVLEGSVGTMNRTTLKCPEFRNYVQECARLTTTLEALKSTYFSKFRASSGEFVLDNKNNMPNYNYFKQHASSSQTTIISPPNKPPHNYSLRPFQLNTVRGLKTFTSSTSSSGPVLHPVLPTTTTTTTTTTTSSIPTAFSNLSMGSSSITDLVNNITPLRISELYTPVGSFEAWMDHNKHNRLDCIPYQGDINSGTVCIVCQAEDIQFNIEPVCKYCVPKYAAFSCKQLFYAKHSGDAMGWGLYAKVDIPPKTLITYYGGVCFEADAAPVGSHIAQITKRVFLDGVPTNSFNIALMVFTNQAGSLCNTARKTGFKNNAHLSYARPQNRIRVVSTEHIYPHSQIFVAYGGAYEVVQSPAPASPIVVEENPLKKQKTIVREMKKKLQREYYCND